MASILDRVRNFISKNAQQTNIDFNKAIYNFLGDSIVWNPENDDTYINKGYRFNSTIYSIINLITKTASTIPFMVYEVKNDNELKRYKSMTSGNFNSNAMLQSKILQKRALVEIEDTELHELLNRPNPAQSYNAWLQEVVAFGKLTGNRYIYGISPESGPNQNKFSELYVLPSQSIEINSGGIFEPVKYYTLDYNGEYKIDAEDVCHIKDFNPYYDGTGSHLYGMSPLKAGLRSLDANNEALTTGVRYLQNQTARGVLMSDEGDLNEVQAKQLKEKFRQQYQGANNAGDVIITPKKLSWVNFGLNASDLSLIEQYNASIKDLCNIYNVPVQLLNNTDSSTYNNMNEAKKSLYVNAVIPELNKIKDELNRWLTPQFGDKLYIDFDYTNIPELQEEMDKVVGQMSQAWWLTPNEKRAAMSYGADDDTPEMNDYYIPSQFIPLDNQDFVIEEEPKSVNIDFSSLLKGDDEDYEVKPVKPGSAVEQGLRNKVDEHNDEYGDDPAKKTNYRTLQTVFNRGIGAYRTNPESVRPNVQNEDQWAYARVNSFLYALRNGKFRSGKHDTDLLPSAHPMSSKKSQKAESYDDYPQGATNNARRMLEWREKYGRDVVQGGTRVGWERANQLANREALSLETVKRVHSFLSRHKGNEVIADEYKDEPWKDKGYVAYNLWGGKAMISWAKRISENEESDN